MTPERSIAIDPRIVTLGAPVFVAATWPNDSKPLQRLMLAQDTGGAIRGAEAGSQAGKMRRPGSMSARMRKGWSPKERENRDQATPF